MNADEQIETPPVIHFLEGHSGSATRSARADRAMYAHIRHELRTPLNAIIGYSEMLLEDEDQIEEGIAADLQNISSAGKQLLSLVDIFLDPARIAAGKLDMDIETVGADLRLQLRTPLNTVVGYSEMLLEEVTDRGYDTISPDLEKIHAAGQRFLDFVNDIGILSRPPQPDAPSPLADADTSAMIESVINTMVIIEEHAATLHADQGVILVVDDNPMNRDLLSRRLERQGHTVALAEDGRQALTMLRTGAFDLVLLDIMMPEMNGYEVLQELKADTMLRDIPVIMISALEDIENVVHCIELGAEDYLPKPFNPTILRARIGASLEKKRLRDQQVLHLQQIEAEKKRADGLLRVILPDAIIDELTRTNQVQPRRYDHVAVLFADIVGFTSYCDQHDAQEILSNLQVLVEAYEDIALRYDIQKIKTIGDSFMGAAGLLKPVENPVLNCARCGLDMIAIAQSLPAKWNVRVGINVGTVLAGVIGQRQYLFDLWGDSVNTAARMESNGIPGGVTMSKNAWQQVEAQCVGKSLGPLPMKGKGELEMFQLIGFPDN